MEKLFTVLSRLALLSIISIFIFTSCGVKKKAIGNEDEIFVVADTTEFVALEGTLLQVFAKVIYTPQPENKFILTRKKLSDLNKLKNRKNVIIIAPLNSGSQTSKYLNSILDSSAKELIQSDSAFVINKYDLWAKNQLVMILTSSDIEKLKKNILFNHDNLLYYFQKISNDRLYESIYNAKYEKKDVEGRLLRDHDWIIYVQADFLLSMDKPEDNFVWLRRAVNTDMERWIFVHWIENATPEMLNQKFIAERRDSLTKKYYVTTDNRNFVQITDDFYKKTSEVNFNGRYALMTEGLWRFSDKSGGGPFISYTFYDEETKRLYMLDGSIFAPKYYKKKLIQQLDVTLQSFMTRSELTEEKIEDLMDEIEDDE